MVRVRLNNDGKRFTQADLSYKPLHLNLTHQRASIPGKSAFYAVSCERRTALGLPVTDYDLPLVIALLETLPELRSQAEIYYDEDTDKLHIKPLNDFRRTVTVSYWRALATINLAEIVVDRYCDQERIRLHQTGFLYDQYFRQHPEQTGPTLEFMKQLALEFTKPALFDSTEYIYSAIASDVIIEKRADGVIYPSVKGRGVGANIAIKPMVIDDGALEMYESFDVVVSSSNGGFFIE